MSEMMTCPICGKQFPTIEYQILDNGNPACPDCCAAESNDGQDQ